jgi:DNA ligase-1
MQRFAELYTRLDSTTATNEKVAALKDYFQSAPAEDAAWAVHFLVGRRLKRLVPNARLREWAGEVTGYPPWMIEECYSSVGDPATTVPCTSGWKRISSRCARWTKPISARP